MFDSLEKRTMFAGATAMVLTVNGTQLHDAITLSQSRNTLTVVKNGISSTHALSGIAGGTTTNTGMPWTIAKVVVNGMAGNDSIVANATVTRRLEIFGGTGHDTIIGGAGADLLCGGSSKTANESGNDSIQGAAGDDELHASMNGNGVLYGQTGNDKIYGYNGNDTAFGSYGNDSMYGGGGNDSLHGNNDNDVIHGQGGADQLFGDNGNDSIYGGTGNDTAGGGAGHDRVHGEDGNDVLFGDAGNDMLFGENHSDRLYGGADADFSFGGEGDDTIVSIGGTQIDNNYGQGGFDSFWIDAESTEYIDNTAYEQSSGRVHRVASFMNLRWEFTSGDYQQSVSRELTGQTLIDPLPHTSGYGMADFSDRPLFAQNGPTMDDIFQGDIGDCYFMAPLSALAKTQPNRMRQLVVDLGDGSYAVHFKRNGQDVFVRVDGDLHTKSNGSPAYAKLGQEDSLWVPIVEKAWAFFRRNQGTYESTASGGGSGTAWYDALNLQSQAAETSIFANATAYLTWIRTRVAEGKAVILGGPANFANSAFEGVRRGQHIYMVNKVNTENGTPVSVELRDPYGAMITIGAQHLFNRSSGARWVS
jgi:hypothetical protein